MLLYKLVKGKVIDLFCPKTDLGTQPICALLNDLLSKQKMFCLYFIYPTILWNQCYFALPDLLACKSTISKYFLPSQSKIVLMRFWNQALFFFSYGVFWESVFGDFWGILKLDFGRYLQCKLWVWNCKYVFWWSERADKGAEPIF